MCVRIYVCECVCVCARCDAFNINHIQCAGRTHSAVYQLGSAHASGAGCAPLRSIIPFKSDPLIAGSRVNVRASGPAGRGHLSLHHHHHPPTTITTVCTDRSP